jgi:hypothetical protein
MITFDHPPDDERKKEKTRKKEKKTCFLDFSIFLQKNYFSHKIFECKIIEFFERFTKSVIVT